METVRARIQERRHLILSGLLLLGLVACGIALVLAVIIPERRGFFIIYMAPLLLAGPLWLRFRVAQIETLSERQLTVDGVVFLAGALRMFGGWGVLPYSGHMLFLTYSMLTTRSLGYSLVAAVLLVMTTIYKLALWDDWSTWLWGLALGIIAAAIWHRASRRRPQ
jgi:hypothetical protein